MQWVQFGRRKRSVLFKIEKLVTENDLLDISKRYLMHLAVRTQKLHIDT
jgi:hypothetical protein